MAYTPPAGDQVDLAFSGEYTPPAGDQIHFVFGGLPDISCTTGGTLEDITGSAEFGVLVSGSTGGALGEVTGSAQLSVTDDFISAQTAGALDPVSGSAALGVRIEIECSGDLDPVSGTIEGYVKTWAEATAHDALEAVTGTVTGTVLVTGYALGTLDAITGTVMLQGQRQLVPGQQLDLSQAGYSIRFVDVVAWTRYRTDRVGVHAAVAQHSITSSVVAHRPAA